MKYIYLSKQFYIDYAHNLFPEIEYKENRPYIMLLMKIDGLTFAIPFRSHITHNYSFLTDAINKCGIDYTKAIIITNQNYVVNNINGLPIKIRENENRALFGKKHQIMKDFKNYVKQYKRAVKNNAHHKVYIFKISTLQYFHKELGI